MYGQFNFDCQACIKHVPMRRLIGKWKRIGVVLYKLMEIVIYGPPSQTEFSFDQLLLSNLSKFGYSMSFSAVKRGRGAANVTEGGGQDIRLLLDNFAWSLI